MRWGGPPPNQDRITGGRALRSLSSSKHSEPPAYRVLTDNVIDGCHQRHCHQQFLAILRQVACAHTRGQLHVIVDNYATHQHPAVHVRLVRHPAGAAALHPYLGLWLKLVKVFFSIITRITRQALRRGSFPTVADLIAAIERFIDAWNDRCRPFTWTKDPDTVVAKATHPRHRKTSTTPDTAH